MEMSQERTIKRAAWFWVLAFLVGMFGTAIFLKTTHYIESPWGMAVLLLPMLLLFPMVRATERWQTTKGCASPVAVRYNRRMLWVSFAYMVGLMAAIFMFKRYELSIAQAALLSLLPTLPIFGMIWAMGRYLIEESDEYLRSRTVNASLIATGFLLAIATFWGFLAEFEVVPQAIAWAAFPVWCLGLGAGHLLMRIRGA